MWNTLIVEPMLNALLWIYNLLGHNFGLAIIVFTVLVRLLTYPLTKKQMESAEAMQRLQQDPRFKKIQEKYKNDRERLAQEQMKLYQELGVSPFASCLPTLIQFPIIIGLYQAVIQALANTPAQLLNLTRHIYPFFDTAALIPLNSRFLWMDLGQPERLYLPFLPGVGIPVLAILVAVTTYLQSKLMTPSSSGQGQDQMAAMSGMMSVYMPLLLFWLTLTFASGLGVYFVASNLVTIGQYALLGKLNWQNLTGERKRKK